MRKIYLTLLLSLFILSGIITGCATHKSIGNGVGTEVKITVENPNGLEWPAGLQGTFEKYWAYRYSDRFEAAYEMEAQKFRDNVSLDQYRLYVKNTSSQHLLGIRLTRMDAHESENGRKIAEAGCKFQLNPDKKQTVETYIQDRWIQVDGQWFHALRDPIIFPKIDYEN